MKHRFSLRSSVSLVLIALVVTSFSFTNVTHAAASVTIQGLSPGNVVNAGQLVSFVASASGFIDPQYSVSDSFSASGSTQGSIQQYGYFTWTPTIYDAGLHTLTVTVTDSAGDTANATVTIQVLSNTILVQSLVPGATVAVGRTVTFSVATPGFLNPYYIVSDRYYAGTTITTSNMDASGNFSWTPTENQQGAHLLNINVTDSSGHNANVQQLITVINPVVTVQSAPATTTPAGVPISFSASVSALTSPSYSVSDTFTGTSTLVSSDINSAGLFNWTASTSDIGVHTIQISATDSLGNVASTTQVLTIGPPLPTTAIVATAATTTLAVPVTGTPTTTLPAAYHFTTYLGIGSKGVAVTALQNLLVTYAGYTGPITGYYGALTAAAVRHFQTLHSLSAVGYVGPLTRAALNQE